MEKLSFGNKSFELVFVKEAIHHVPRPILALYEMLRVAKKAVIFIEPEESLLGNCLDRMGFVSKYEKNQDGNFRFRDNFVYRWRRKEIIKILNSYYLESGYKAVFTSCWLSNRVNDKFPLFVRAFNFIGWLVSFLPGCKGNYIIGTIYPGKNLPE
jgi:ubiquinone/menaquinone biosynthesis C-methylase UbiE